MTVPILTSTDVFDSGFMSLLDIHMGYGHKISQTYYTFHAVEALTRNLVYKKWN